MSKITLVPVGGLANRMRTIASTVTLAGKVSADLEIVWFRDWALGVAFHQLFQPWNTSLFPFPLKEASCWDHVWLDRPRSRNFHLPACFQKLVFSHRIYEREVRGLCDRGFDFEAWAKAGKRCYLASYTDFLPYDLALVSQLFVPVTAVAQEIEQRCQAFPDTVIGVHIRRTDNVLSIQGSPLELFTERLDADLQQHPQLGIYLATDSEEVKQTLQARYGKRVITATQPADRSSLQGIREGLVDMYTLARTQKIYGSFGSSFSEMAAQLGGIPLEILQR